MDVYTEYLAEKDITSKEDVLYKPHKQLEHMSKLNDDTEIKDEITNIYFVELNDNSDAKLNDDYNLAFGNDDIDIYEEDDDDMEEMQDMEHFESYPTSRTALEKAIDIIDDTDYHSDTTDNYDNNNDEYQQKYSESLGSEEFDNNIVIREVYNNKIDGDEVTESVDLNATETTSATYLDNIEDP
jgi:hypothetical protein